MSDKDLSRYKVINDVCKRRLNRVDAAKILNLSERQAQHSTLFGVSYLAVQRKK